MSKKYKAILFDLDGTLLDTSEGIYKGLDYMMPRMGRELIPQEEKYPFIGPALKLSFQERLGMTPEESEEAIKIYRTYNRNHGFKEFNYYPGMDELLEKLRERGYLLLVVTMKVNDLAHKTVGASPYTPLFDYIVGNDDFTPLSKAQLSKRTLDQLGLKPEEVIFIGDTAIDAKGAEELGMNYCPAMYGFGYSHEDVSEDYPYVTKLYKPTDLLDFLDSAERN